MVAHSRAGGHQEIHAADMLAQICTEARKAALRVKTKQLRQHWLWLTITKPAEQLAERFAGPCLFNATHHGTCSPKGNPRLHGPFDNVHLDTAYAEQAGWQHSWSLHYNNNLKCWLDSEGYNDLPDKACSSLHKSLHMVMGRPYGALLEAIVATGSCVPLPIPGSMITGLKLKAYLIIESHAPSRSVTYEAAANDTINGIDDLTASMAVAGYQRGEVRERERRMPVQPTPQSPPSSKPGVSKLTHLSASFSRTMDGAGNQPAHPAPALQVAVAARLQQMRVRR